MSVRIRLARYGAKKKPYYQVVVANSRAPRNGAFIEKVGIYNPFAKDETQKFKVILDRVQYWLSVGALPSDVVERHFKRLGISA